MGLVVLVFWALCPAAEMAARETSNFGVKTE